MAEQLTLPVNNPDLDFIRTLRATGGDSVKKCYQCATCSVVCTLSVADHPFPRKEMLWAGWGQKDRLLSDPDVWLCHQCGDCTSRCPRGARPGDVLGAVRSYIFKHFAFPRFMGQALTSAKALPLLFLIPILVIGGLFFWHTGGDLNLLAGPVIFAKFIPHGYIEMLFMGGNALIFLFAAFGLWRFYKGLARSLPPGGQAPGFFRSAVATFFEVMSHKRFNECGTNHIRYIAHMLVLFGFIGAVITAGLAVLALILFDMESPIPMSNPIKWLGNASGLAMLIGLAIMFVRRGQATDDTGTNTYADWLFLSAIALVTLTGFGSQFFRLADWPVAAYGIYFVHLVFVFFLLWYAPYSKFAHMFYRSLALTFARSRDRVPQ